MRNYRIAAVAVAVLACAGLPSGQQLVDWPTYNRTLTSDRYAPLTAIDRRTVAELEVVCSYDVGQMVNFQSGLIEVGNQLIVTTDTDTVALDPTSCKEIWRTREELSRNDGLRVNRGAAYLDGRVFRGTPDGRVIAYDAKRGSRLWATTITVAGLPETVPAAPIAWNGLVFVGVAGGDSRGVKGRVYALDAQTGRIAWEAYLVPKARSDPSLGPSVPQPAEVAASWANAPDVPISGGGSWTSYALDPATGTLYVPTGNPSPDFTAYLRPGSNLFTGSVVALDAKTGAYGVHYPMVQADFHDWDVSSAPVIVTTRGGTRTIAATPKDGYLYAFELASGKPRFRTAVTTISNAAQKLTSAGTRFCPGVKGGSEWNGPAFDPTRNLFFTGEVDWCSTVTLAPDEETKRTPVGQAWSGAISANTFGKDDPISKWSGRVVATDADAGTVKWRFAAPFPVVSGVTATASGLVFFGDVGGNLYALSSDTGAKVWSKKIGGAIGGGVITYGTTAGQRIAVATGMTSRIWPTEKVNAAVVILGVRRPVQ